MEEVVQPLPSIKKNKKGKKRRRPPKKKSLGGDDDGTSNNCTSITTNDANQQFQLDGGIKASIQEKHKTKGSIGNKTNKQKVRSGDYPYPTDYNDHFETPGRAYDDIYPLLEHHIRQFFNNRKDKWKKSDKNKKSNTQSETRTTDESETILYDPYYCAGRAAILLRETFRRNDKSRNKHKIRVQHEKRDFYADIQRNALPAYDIFITNPPYSSNHKERALEFAVSQLKRHNKPFFLLMPNYVATKDYFKKIVLGDGKIRTVYVTPAESYEYDHPEGTGKDVVPFRSVWFCGLSYDNSSDKKEGNGGKGGKTPEWIRSVIGAFAKFHSSSSVQQRPRISTSLQELICTGGVSGDRRPNPRQRKKMRQLAMQRAGNANVAGGGNVSAVNSTNKGGKPISQKRKSSNDANQHGGKEGRSHKKRKFK
mmetsp:Transcript_24763/g.52532  ORF Transcript_24763/g.52532 Transcript_24763/m.52532 type:complete len:423 (-) Transcript_24763:18-1286(-)